MQEFHIDARWALVLGSALAWTTLFSLLHFPLRGLRNVGILASYALGIAMAVQLPWRNAAATWLAFGVAGGIAYLAYDVWSRMRQPEPREPLQLGALLHGPLAWPIMAPEAVEYFLADAGVLKVQALPPAASDAS